ncbi:MAG: hypothetical protein AB7O62_16365 [Pirellulales bacterium]
MLPLPRLAIGTVQPRADSRPITWALLDLFCRQGLHVQHFLSSSRFAACDAALPVTGQASRHLDSWLMEKQICRELFLHGADANDLALVEGRFAAPVPTSGSRLETLADWLDLPRVAVVDVAQLTACGLPRRPERLDAMLLDQCADDYDFYRWQTVLEPLWGVPVLGGLPRLPQIRRAMAELSRGTEAPRKLCHDLGDHFFRYVDLAKLLALASRRGLPPAAAHLFCRRPGDRPVRVAVAYDDAFRGYFPDTLDLLEARGAELVDFSPLRDEELPPDTDIVYVGCGHPERYASQLADNYCLISELRNHVCAGRRMYAEGGGLAYLCGQISWPDGSRAAMSGVLPGIATFHPHAPPPLPVETSLAADNWLGRQGTRLRGYRNMQWGLRPAEAAGAIDTTPEGQGNLFSRHHAVASRLHLNFAAQPAALAGFLRRHETSLSLAIERL